VLVLCKRRLFFRKPEFQGMQSEELAKHRVTETGITIKRSMLPQQVPDWIRETPEFKLANGTAIRELTAAGAPAETI
jgi:hypothetical protein